VLSSCALLEVNPVGLPISSLFPLLSSSVSQICNVQLRKSKQSMVQIKDDPIIVFA
jgi:hypothetical protein